MVEGPTTVITGSPRAYRLRGLLSLLVLPLAFGVLVAVLGGMVDAPEDVLLVVWLVTVVVSVAYGLVLLVGAERLARRHLVRFDGARRVVVVGAAEHPYAGLSVELVRRSALAFSRLELVRDGAVVATIHDRLGEPHGADAAALVRHLSGLLGLPAAIPASPAPSVDDRTAAMLCYLPIQGIHLVASLYYLFSARERPFVHFAARQSLAQVAVTLGGLVVSLLGLGLPLALVAGGERSLPVGGVVLTVLLVVALSALAIANLVAHGIAAVRAYRGEVWVIPWLRRWFREGPRPAPHQGQGL